MRTTFLASAATLAIALALSAMPAVSGTSPVLKPVTNTPIVKSGFKPVTQKISGNLTCDLLANTCKVRNMPLLGQGDPALTAPLKAYVDTLADANGMVHDGSFDKDGKPNLITSQALTGAIQGYGCLITSSTMVLHAAFADAPIGLKVAGRDGQMLAAQFPGLSKAQSELLWQYETQASQIQGMNYPYNGDQGPIYIGVADIPNDVSGVNMILTDEVPTAATAPTITDSLVTGMKGGAIYGVSFQWSTLVPLYSHGNLIAFDIYEAGPHKVAFDGFSTKPGNPYPLIVNDPGSGATVNVRLSSSVASLDLPVPKTPKIDQLPIYLVGADGTRTLFVNPPVFFVYSGAEPNGLGKPFKVKEGWNETGFPIVVVEDIWSIRLAPSGQVVTLLPVGSARAVSQITHPIPKVTPDDRMPPLAIPGIRGYNRN